MHKKSEEEKKPVPSILGSVFITGISGGLLWSSFFVILYLFNFSEIAPNTYLLKPWSEANWIGQWQGHFLSIFISGIISIIPSLIYYFLFKKINSMWVGVFYGVFLWLIVLLLLQPLLGVAEPITDLEIETIISTLAVFILYGTFIGYSIAYDYYDMRVKADEGKVDELKTEL